VNVVSAFLTQIGLWPKPRLPKEDAAYIASMLKDAATEANSFAGELETIAEKTSDPFGTFAQRARQSQFRRHN
jgi:hypothetical protein